MAASTAALTVEQFRRLPEHETLRCELVDGEIVNVGNAKFRHEWIKANILQLLVPFSVQEGAVRIFSETSFDLNESNIRQPDVSVVRTRRAEQIDMDGYPRGAPDLAIEIVSSETAADLEAKVELYIATGAAYVWVVYPEQRVIRVHDKSADSRLLREGQTLEALDLMPGFSADVGSVFEGA
jgi:Uma2 family endonuclease